MGPIAEMTEKYSFTADCYLFSGFQKSLEEQTGCLLKFSGELDNMTSREDIHALFQDHGEIKWIDFSRGSKEVNVSSLL